MPIPLLVLYPVASVVAAVGLSVAMVSSANKTRTAARKRIEAAHGGPKKKRSRRSSRLPAHRPSNRELTQPESESLRGALARVIDTPQGMPLALSLGGLCLSAAAYAMPAVRLPALALSLVGAAPLVGHGLPNLARGRIDESVFHVVFLSTTAVIGAPFLMSFLACIAYSGELLTEQAQDRSRQDLSDIFGGQQRTAWVRSGETELEVDVERLAKGDLVICRGGDVIPVDGVIHSGTAMIDQHVLFGEQYPVAKAAGDAVYSGTTVTAGEIEVSLHRAGAQSVAGQVTRMLSRTSDYRSRVVRRADREAKVLLPAALAAGAVAAPILGISAALGLLMSCPGVVFLYTAPFATVTALQVAAERGVLVKDGRALEVLPEIDTVLFDKTGTLTLDTPEVGSIAALAGTAEEEILGLAAAAEQRHSHPIAKALVARAEAAGLELAPAQDSEMLIGRGIAALVGERRVVVGSARLMDHVGLAIPPSLFEPGVVWTERGSTAVFVAVDDHILGAIELCHQIRPGAAACIAALQKRGIACEIVSGDAEATTISIAARLGLQHFHANRLPEQKVEIVLDRQRAGRKVCFIGDGINDAVALKAADISISMSGASHAATDTAAMVLLSGDLSAVAAMFDIADSYHRANRLGRGLSYTLPSATLVSTLTLGTSPLVAMLAQDVAYWGALGAAVLGPRRTAKTGATPPALAADPPRRLDAPS